MKEWHGTSLAFCESMPESDGRMAVRATKVRLRRASPAKHAPAAAVLLSVPVLARVEQALRAGATVVRPLKDQFYGERSGTVRDPFGHEWLLGGHLEDVSSVEVQRRYSALFEQ